MGSFAQVARIVQTGLTEGGSLEPDAWQDALKRLMEQTGGKDELIADRPRD